MKKFVVLTIVGLLIFGTIGIIAGSKVLKAQDEPIWPMFGFDAQRTNQCPYDASNNNGIWKWRYELSGYNIHGSPVIASDGTIFYAGYDRFLYALSPDGILKWKYGGNFSSPLIASDGIIYVSGSEHINNSDKTYLYAINPDGTLKWKFETGSWIFPSPAIDSKGIIYASGMDDPNNSNSHNGYLYALNPDGTLKWKYSGLFDSSPAITKDGTIYVSGEEYINNIQKRYLYAINPDGTLKHKWNVSVDYGPAIGPDGTAYIISSCRLMAFSPDGNLKWKYSGYYFNSLPAIAKDGTIYIKNNENFYAINPDGTLKWGMQYIYSSYQSTPVVGKNGTIYIGGRNCIYIINPDGTLKHKISLHYMSKDIDFDSIIFDNNGTIYTRCSDGYLYAIGNPDVTLPTTPQNLKVERASAALKLTWDASTKGTYPIAGYAIYRSTDGGKHFSFLDTTVDTSTTYTDYSVNADTTYYYYVTAFDNRTPPDESEPSNVVSMGPPDFNISVNPTEQTINQGNSATFTVTLTSMFGFNSEVTLSALSMPYGVTAKFDPETLTPTESGVTSTLTLTVSDTAPTGNFNINIKGTSGSKTHYANITLTIKTSDFNISVNPTEQTINQGNSATFTVTLTSMFGFNSEVTLSALSMPYGVTAKFDPETLTPTESGVTSTLTLTVSDTAPTGNFNINIKGTSDSKTHYANIALTITNTGIKKGDVNQDGKITAQDAILVLRYHAGYITLTEKQLSAADMNNDGKVDETDAQLILKKAVGL